MVPFLPPLARVLLLSTFLRGCPGAAVCSTSQPHPWQGHRTPGERWRALQWVPRGPDARPRPPVICAMHPHGHRSPCYFEQLALVREFRERRKSLTFALPAMLPTTSVTQDYQPQALAVPVCPRRILISPHFWREISQGTRFCVFYLSTLQTFCSALVRGVSGK